VFASPPFGVKVIRAVTVTLPFRLSFAFASLPRRSGTVIAGGSPPPLDGFSRSFFFFAAAALSLTAASVTATFPVA
jgi:hypothetical protein